MPIDLHISGAHYSDAVRKYAANLGASYMPCVTGTFDQPITPEYLKGLYHAWDSDIAGEQPTRVAWDIEGTEADRDKWGRIMSRPYAEVKAQRNRTVSMMKQVVSVGKAMLPEMRQGTYATVWGGHHNHGEHKDQARRHSITAGWAADLIKDPQFGDIHLPLYLPGNGAYDHDGGFVENNVVIALNAATCRKFGDVEVGVWFNPYINGKPGDGLVDPAYIYKAAVKALQCRDSFGLGFRVTFMALWQSTLEQVAYYQLNFPEWSQEKIDNDNKNVLMQLDQARKDVP